MGFLCTHILKVVQIQRTQKSENRYILYFRKVPKRSADKYILP